MDIIASLLKGQCSVHFLSLFSFLVFHPLSIHSATRTKKFPPQKDLQVEGDGSQDVDTLKSTQAI